MPRCFPATRVSPARPHGASPRKPPRPHPRAPISPSPRTAPAISAPCRARSTCIPANNTTKRYINIRNGTYQEIVRVSSKHNLAFRGQNRKRTIIAYPNNSNLNPSTNTRPLFNVVANDVSFDNLTLHNTTPDGGSQAEALRVNAQRCVVNNCDLRSYQDTFLVNSAADTAYFKDSLIEGDADFIWGTGRAVFQSCEIKSLDGGYVCAMRNPAGQYGAVFLDCRFTRSPA